MHGRISYIGDRRLCTPALIDQSLATMMEAAYFMFDNNQTNAPLMTCFQRCSSFKQCFLPCGQDDGTAWQTASFLSPPSFFSYS